MKKVSSAAFILSLFFGGVLAQSRETSQDLKLAKSVASGSNSQKGAELDEVASDANDSLAARKFYDSGVAAYEGGKLDEAVGAFKAAGKLTPEDPQVYYMLGMTYAKSKAYKDSFDAFKRAAKLKSEWPEAQFRLGVIAYVLGRKNQSVDAYNKLLKLDTELAGTLNRIIKQDNNRPGAVENLEAGNWLPSKTETSKPALSANSSSASSVNTVKPIKEGATPSGDLIALSGIYRVGVGDVLDIRLLNSSTARSTLYTVIDGGLIDFTIAGGPIVVAGLTTDEIQGRIVSELKRRAVEENARVSVGVRQYASHSVTITGLVNHPGTKFLRREAVPLYVIMAEAQARLDAARVTIMRTGAPNITLDLSEQAALNLMVRHGDIISVTARPQEYYYIGGRINYPGQKIFQPGITLVQAILAAGGLLGDSDSQVELSREGSDGRLATSTFKLKEIKKGKIQDPRLQPGDRIEVRR
jgi:protein involved in polysaccharide export with SLBB domain